MTHVPYRGASPAFTDLIPGRVDCYFGSGGLLSYARSGVGSRPGEHRSETRCGSPGSCRPSRKRGVRGLRRDGMAGAVRSGQDPA